MENLEKEGESMMEGGNDQSNSGGGGGDQSSSSGGGGFMDKLQDSGKDAYVNKGMLHHSYQHYRSCQY